MFDCSAAAMAPKAAEEQKAGKSKAEKKPVVKKAEKKIKADTKGDAKKKRSKKSVETYKIYIYKVLKQVRSPLPPRRAALVNE